ncbi:MAG: hypothetical protein PVI06_07250 [Desulfobacterales bacterium]|jgi:hypothetical protein
MEGSLSLKVECYAGYRGEERPRCIWMGKRKITVLEVIDRWLAPDHRYFKILGDDRATYIIRHDIENWRWELIFYRQIEDSNPEKDE